MNKKVILVDDNAWEHVAGRMKSAFALSGLDLTVIQSVDHCGPLFQDESARCPADIFIVDLMMPPGETYKTDETHDGLITGLYLARDIRARFPLVPIVLWSGSSLDTVRLLAAHVEKKLTKCIFVKKPISGEKLVALINGYFEAGRFSHSWVRKVWDGIVLRPAIGGLGIDVKQLLDPKN